MSKGVRYEGQVLKEPGLNDMLAALGEVARWAVQQLRVDNRDVPTWLDQLAQTASAAPPDEE